MNRCLLSGIVIDPPRTDTQSGRRRQRIMLKPRETPSTPVPVYVYPSTAGAGTVRQGAQVVVDGFLRGVYRRVNGAHVIIIEIDAVSIESAG